MQDGLQKIDISKIFIEKTSVEYILKLNWERIKNFWERQPETNSLLILMLEKKRLLLENKNTIPFLVIYFIVTD